MPIFIVRDENGNTHDIPAIKGEPGHTPVLGIDYLTEDELVELDARFYSKLVDKLTAHNLLDNSDFRNPVNQRNTEGGSLASGIYFIDRWTTISAGAVSFGSDGISIGCNVAQHVQIGTANKTLTFATKVNGKVYVCSGTYQNANAFSRIAFQTIDGGGYIALDDIGDQIIRVLFAPTTGVTVEWAALYEGEYTLETIPVYRTKGYATELIECQRYYQRYPMYVAANETAMVPIHIPLRKNPSAAITLGAGTVAPAVSVLEPYSVAVTAGSEAVGFVIMLSADL